MAESRAVINVDINTSDAAAGLRQLQGQLNAFNSSLTKSSAVQATAMRNAKDNLLELVNASRFFTAETVKMQTAAGALDKTLSKGQVTLGQFFSAKFRKDGFAAAEVMSLANTRAAALQTQFVATGAAANGFRDAIAIRPLQAFNDAAVVSAQKLAIQRAMLNQATTSMINFGKNTQWAGRQLMVGFTVPLTIFGGLAGKTFMELEKEAVNFKKVYGDAFTTPAELEANLKAVQELGKEYTKYGIAVKDTVGLAAQAAAAGAKNQDLLDATAQSTRLATLGQMDQNQALETTISLQNAFKLSGDDLAKSINFLNMVENQTVVTLQDLSAAIPRVAPVIQGLGGSVEDLAAMLAAMEEGGVTAEQGANALKSGLASLINPTDRAKEKLQELGISLDTIIQANRGDLMGTIQAFSRALASVDEFSRQQALEQVFGKFQYARLGALFDNITKAGSQASRVLEVAGLSAGEMAASAEKELSAIEESVGTKLTAAMERLKLAIAPIGELFVKMATPIVNFLASIAEGFNNLPDGAKKFLGIATVITGLVIPAGTMFLGLLMNLLGTLVKFGNILGLAFKGFVSGGFKGAFDNVSQALRYMSLSEIDAANAAQQLAGTTEAVNAALRSQVGASEGAQAAVMELAFAYEILTRQMNEAAAANSLVFGVGAAAMGQAGRGGPRITRNRGGTIPGSGNTDTVPAMLTPGEFVINKQATKENLPLLKAINSGKMIGLSGGAFIGARLAAAAASVKPILSSSQVASELGISERSLRRISLNLELPKLGGTYQYTPELIPLLQSAVQTKMQKTHTTPFRSMTAMSSQIPGESDRAQVARMLADAGIPIELLDDAWLRLPFNQALRGKGISGRDLLSQMEFAIKDQGSSFWGPAWSGINKKVFMEKLKSNIDLNSKYTDYGARGEKNFGSLIWESASQSGGLNRNVTGAYIPKVQELTDSIDTLNNFYPDKIFDIKEEGGYKYLKIYDKTTGKELYSEMARGSYGFNKGSIVPGQGNKDTVPAMLTPGEFVVNKKATQSNMALLQAINNGQVAKYARGGRVELTSSGQGGSFEYAVIDPEGNTVGFFPNKDDAEAARAQSESDYRQRLNARRRRIGRSNRRERTASMLRGMGGMKGMGISMGAGMAGGAMMMGAGMVQESNPNLATAMNFGGMAMSMGSMLPMLAPMLAPLAGIAVPALAVTAALGVTAAALYAWRKSVDESARAAADLAANAGVTSNALNTMAKLFGQQTPAQRAAQLQLGVSAEEQAVMQSTEFQNIFTSEEGQKFIQDLQDSTSAERFKKLSDYLKAAIASGIMDKTQASAFAKAIGSQLGDVTLGTSTATAIREQEAGAQAMLKLAQERMAAVPAMQVGAGEISSDKAAAGIGGAIQVIQDFANAEALAREQFAQGTIEYEEMQSVVNQAREAQAKYTTVIQQAMDKTSDFGATMQATKDQLISANLISEEGFAALESASKKGVTNKAIIAGRGVVSGRGAGAQIVDQDLLGAATSAIAGGMNVDIATQIAQSISNGEGLIADAYQKALDAGASAQEAFGRAGATEQLLGESGLLTGVTMGSGKMGAGRARAAASTLLSDFTAGGGDEAQLTSFLGGVSVENRGEMIRTMLGLDQEGKTKMIADSQVLAQNIGQALTEKLQMSNVYEKALTAPEGTEGITSAVERAAEVGVKENIIEYAINTTANGEPADLEDKINELTTATENISSLPEEMIKGLGIDITLPQDLKTFGPIVDSLKQNWPIIQNLNPNIDMTASMKFITMGNGKKLLTPEQISKNVITLNKAWEGLSSKNKNTRLEAIRQLIFSTQDAKGNTLDPEQVDAAYNDLIDRFGGKIMNLPPDVINKIISIQVEVEGIDEAIAGYEAQLAVAGSAAMAQSIIENINTLKASKRVLKQEQKTTVSAAPKTSAGGGGGGGEKSIQQQLKESANIASGFANAFGGKTGAELLGKPFGPEFLQYLKSQGQKGLDLLKGNLTKLKQAYDNFRKEQKAESLMVLQFMPAQLQDELKARKANLYLVKNISKQYGVTTQQATEMISVLEGQEKIDLMRQMRAGKISKEFKDTLKISQNIALWDEKNAQLLEYMAMSAEDLSTAMRDNAMEINDLQRQIAEIEIIKPLQDQLDAQQKIIDGQQKIVRTKQQELDTIARTIELEQRKIEPIDKQIESYENQIDTINNSYDAQLKALDEIYRKEDDLAALREGKMDVASALARGDVGAAAQAALQLQRTMTQQRQANTEKAIEQARQQEIEAVEVNINNLKEQRKTIESEIERLQGLQRDKQDEIYNIQNNLILPAENKIFELQGLINEETDKLDDLYSNAANQLVNLQTQLSAALRLQNELNAAAGKGSSATTPAQAPTASSVAAVEQAYFDSIYNDPYIKEIRDNLSAMGFMTGGLVGKYAMGGMVSYKGSREKAPGFMMGGRIRKYAAGSFVPGTGMTDKVPALLTPGEFVVRKPVAQAYRPLLESLNGQIYPKMNPADVKFNVPVSSASYSYPQTNLSTSNLNYTNAPTNVQYSYNVNVSAATNASADDIANVIMHKIKRLEDRNVRGTQVG